MSIFGSTYPKYKIGSTEYELPHSVLEPEYYVPDYITHKSILTGDKNFLNDKHYSSFWVDCNLFKLSEADRIALIQALFNNMETDVEFYPHSDGTQIKNEFGDTVYFRIKDVKPYYIENLTTYDAVKVLFDSMEHTKLIVNTEGFGFDYGMDYGTHY